MIAAVVPCTRTPSSQPRSIPAVLDAQVRRRPEATAAIAERGDRIGTTTWNELGRRVRDLAEGFASVGVEKGNRVALLADTALDAVVAGLAVVAAGGVMVPIHPTSTPRDCEHVLSDSGATWIVCDVEAQADKVHGLRERVPALRGIVRLSGPARGPFEVDAAQLARAAEVARAREGNAQAAHLPTLGPHDPICIIYTSGTTGNPKGVLLTHGNWLYAAEALAQVGVVVEDDVCLLFLPIAHGFAWLCAATCIQVGAGMAFASIDRVVEAAGRLRPTFIPAPPRLYEKIYASAVAAGEAERGVKRRLFRLAMDELARATAARVRGLPYSSLGLTLARKVVLPRVARAVSEKLGGRVRVLVSGSAPLSPRVYAFFEALGFTLLEGFGQSECTGAATVNLPGAARIGTVGPPLPGTEIRIAEDGEILLRNPGVMHGYRGNPAATAEALRGGWLHTGDVGEIDDRGYLRITDRKKGHHRDVGRKEGLAPEPRGGAEGRRPDRVAGGRAWRQAQLPGRARLRRASAGSQLERGGGSRAGAAPVGGSSRARARAACRRRVNAQLPRHATIKRFAMLPRDLTVEAGELTATMKLRRRFCEERYAHLIEALYAGGTEAPCGT